METGQQILDAVLEYFRSGFYGVNGAAGAFDRHLAAYYHDRLAADFHGRARCGVPRIVVLDVMIPVLARSGRVSLCRRSSRPSYWQNLLKLYAGYLIVVSVFFLVKRLLRRRALGFVIAALVV